VQVTLASNGDVTSPDSLRSCVRVDQCVSAVRAVEVPVFVCLRSSCCHVTVRGTVRFVRLNPDFFFTQNDGKFVDVILLYRVCPEHKLEALMLAPVLV
jgi:hypothetical protein